MTSRGEHEEFWAGGQATTPTIPIGRRRVMAGTDMLTRIQQVAQEPAGQVEELPLKTFENADYAMEQVIQTFADGGTLDNEQTARVVGALTEGLGFGKGVTYSFSRISSASPWTNGSHRTADNRN